MQLKEIILKDFCQFRGEQKISFSTDKEKNVTIVIGENGTGKTKISQAFTWCLYGKTKITDSNLLCHAIKLSPKEECSVWVRLEFMHNGKDYYCKRELSYYLDSTGIIKLKNNNSKFELSYIDSKEGQMKTIYDSAAIGEINKILPEELSDYFFFDGEHINEISKNIINKEKVQDFSDAVKHLLGLSALEKALEHLKGTTNRNSVVKMYEQRFSSDGDAKLEEIISELKKLKNEEIELQVKKKDIEKKIKDAENCKVEIERKLEGFKEIKNNLELRKEKQKSKENLEINRKNNISDLFKYFDDSSYNFFNKKLIKDVLELLSSQEIVDKGIPDITNRTLDYILERKKCICGRYIEDNSKDHDTISKLYEYIPPQSLGGSITTFIEDARGKTNHSDDFIDTIEQKISIILDQNEKISNYEDELVDISKKIGNHSNENIASLERERNDVEEYIKKFSEDLGVYKNELDNISKKIKSKESELDISSQNNSHNKEMKKYIAYAKYIYKIIDSEYSNEEKNLRGELEKNINDIFKEMFKGGLSLRIDDKYRIKVIEDKHNYSGNIDISTGQRFAIILSFISAIIKMAKDKPSYSDNNLMASEAYPLVMDAPISVFDKDRVETICNILPRIAEQVIIFINDKDGEIANKNMKDRIAKRYKFNKENEFETQIEEQNYV